VPVRDPARGERLLPGAGLATGDLEKPDTLRTAVSGVDAGVMSPPESPWPEVTSSWGTAS